MEALEYIKCAIDVLCGAARAAEEEARAAEEEARAEARRNTLPVTYLYLVDQPDPAFERNSFKTFERKVLREGTFMCPVCQEMQPFKQKELYLNFSCCFIHFPCCDEKFDGYEYIKCKECQNHFQVDILDWPNSKAKKALDKAILRAIIRIKMVTTINLPLIRQVYESTTGTTISKDDIKAEVEECARLGNVVMEFKGFVPFLSPEQKDTILKAMIQVAVADGDLNRDEATVLLYTGDVLEVSNSHIKDLLKHRLELEQGNSVPPVPKEECAPERKQENKLHAVSPNEDPEDPDEC